MLTSHEENDTTQTMIVNLNAFDDSSVDFIVHAFDKTTNWVRFHQIKEDVLLKISHIIETSGAEIAFQTSAMLLESFTDKSAEFTK
jgi:MscS family membrane protein